MHSTLSDVPVESLLASVDSVPSAQTTIRTMHRQLVEAHAENRRIFSYERVWTWLISDCAVEHGLGSAYTLT
ncbi:hypothetical protein CQR49_0087 [Bifidobacterium pseudolongum subsp. pseudolongum]|uniref:hypothetical protein n=1 Tax=Bifidobacterium pseudolongum TaxID=1694 RepID=UPI000CC7E7F0|nr:hypothetical protein [Bifidobacterium pseudolongum]PKV09182.1 hypothetical protein CQR49_0087 [Bifidobacterium pseudolongum subsp. pseudolongum]